MLPGPLRDLPARADGYPLRISEAVKQLADEVDRNRRAGSV